MEITNANEKVAKTNLTTLGDIQTLFSNAGATNEENSAMSDVICGSSIAQACNDHGLAIEGETKANTINRARNRFATIMLGAFKTIAQPIADQVSAEAAKAAEVEAAAALETQIAEWEANGQRGRRPGEANRPKHLIAVEKAHAEARRDAREHLGIAAQGRINPDLQDKFVIEFRARYTKALTQLAKKFDSIDTEKIEKMVNKGVKALAVSKSAQKAQKPTKAKATKAKTKKSKKTADVPATEAPEATEAPDSEAVTAE